MRWLDEYRARKFARQEAARRHAKEKARDKFLHKQNNHDGYVLGCWVCKEMQDELRDAYVGGGW